MTHYPKSNTTTLRYDFLLDNNTLITNNRLAKNSHRKSKKKNWNQIHLNVNANK